MLIDYEHFTPVMSLIGGLVIGIAVSILLLVNGRIAGISGIVIGLGRLSAGDFLWRVFFILGLIIAPMLYQFFFRSVMIVIDTNWFIIVLAGCLVGIGTRFGRGCTSGHGICGISQFSLRSVIATISYMFTGMICIFIVRHFL